MIQTLMNVFDEGVKTGIELTGMPRLEIVIILIAVFAIYMVIYGLIFYGIMKLNKAAFRAIGKKRGKSITFQFMEKVVALIIIIFMIVIPLGGDMISRSLLGSTAVIAAVVGLAANDVIKDMFAGLQISVYKLFEVGDRIMLEDGRCGIVKELTLRHVVLALVDTNRLIVPNSKVNTMCIVNYSYVKDVPRAFEIRIPVSYSTDVEKAKKVIKDTICASPYSLNEDKYDENDPNSKSVYFLDINENAYILGATVYYPHELRTEVVKDEIYSGIVRAFADNGIEIPYNYMNIVMKERIAAK